MNIKKVIKDHGFTISQVSERLNCSQSALSQSINNNPSVERLREISKVIGCRMSDFFADETEDANTFVCPKCGTRLKVVEVED